MKILKHVWDEEGRPCSFSLCLQGGCVFADFNIGEDGRVSLVRISFDGYGCYSTESKVTCLSFAESQNLIERIDANDVDRDEICQLLYQYFDRNKDDVWRDAMEEHGLLRARTNE